jgi:general secretion pathway protein K
LKDERGFALVITLIITALLVALTAEFVDEVYVDTSLGHNFVAGQQASILASSGVDGGIRLLQFNLSLQTYSSLLDRWAQPLKIDDELGKLLISIEEESGKLNLNAIAGPNGVFDTTYYPIAVRLLKKLELSPDLCDALADWVGTNEVPHPAGAKSSYYNNLKPPYGAKNAKLETLEELALVKGFSSKVLEKLRPFVTVYPDQPNAPSAPININTAPQEVIAALAEDMTDDLTARVLEYRKTTPFKDKSDIVKVAGMQIVGQRLQTTTTAKGAVYRIRSEASVRETTRAVEAVVRILGSGPKAYTVLYWREF